ncbi:anti-sigma factor [Mesorhizobium sp. BE184]|uniref:anti-sigma factor n=1 Tax=Mesorhizobium sp. BE184 TaxID=2817714 RepID=UPI002855523F|nr:anti-sigma factor [Mesorhizobium sp. BE184]MDR7031400.1 hypothetical protein [Mesorhizobium sp. BE184]
MSYDGDMSEAGKMSRRDEMEALLPFYLNGTLDGAELADLEAWLATDPAAAAALEEAEAEFSGTIASNEAVRPPADAFARFAKQLDAETGRERKASSSAPSVVTRLWNGFRAVPASFAWAAAAALLAFVVVQQVAAPNSGPGFEVAGAENDLAKLPFALVKFKPDARMADVVTFMGNNGLKIASGPTVDGIFRIAIATTTGAEYDRLFALIAAQPFTETALGGRKPVDG